jgi:hypothetical protein
MRRIPLIGVLWLRIAWVAPTWEDRRSRRATLVVEIRRGLERFAKTLRPDNPRIDDLRAFLTEQRIRELQTEGDDGEPKK